MTLSENKIETMSAKINEVKNTVTTQRSLEEHC